MKPSALHEEVSRQALDRFNSKMKQSENQDALDHNMLVTNMLATDHTLAVRNQ